MHQGFKFTPFEFSVIRGDGLSGLADALDAVNHDLFITVRPSLTTM